MSWQQQIERIGPENRIVAGLFREHRARYAFAQELARGLDVVDLGSGEGYGSALLATVARRVVAIDRYQPAVRRSIDRYRLPGLNFVVGDVRSACLKEQSADLVVAFEVIEHLDDIEGFLSEVRRLLRPNGRFVVSTPNRRIHSLGRTHPIVPFHSHEFTLGEFRDALAEHFQVERIAGQSSLGRALATHLASYLELGHVVGAGKVAERSATVAGPASEQSLYFIGVCRIG